jgi:hypothetical protein
MRLIQRLPLSTGLPADSPGVLSQMRLGIEDVNEAHEHIRAAAAELEAYCGVAILPQTITAETDDAPGALLHLPVRPVLDPATLTITTTAGTPVTTWRLVSAAHAVVRFVTPPDEPVTVTYDAGHATVDDVPPDLLHAIGDQALRLYDLRGAEEGTQGLSLAAARIGARYRRVAL